MRIGTWNIGEDETKENGNLDIYSYEYIRKTIEEKNIDILCLQEAIIKSNYLPSIADYIKEYTNLKYNIQYELSDSHINIGCRMGVVICSKYEITDYELNASNVQQIVIERWQELFKNTKYKPIDIHTPLWLWSRNGFKEVK